MRLFFCFRMGIQVSQLIMGGYMACPTTAIFVICALKMWLGMSNTLSSRAALDPVRQHFATCCQGHSFPTIVIWQEDLCSAVCFVYECFALGDTVFWF